MLVVVYLEINIKLFYCHRGLSEVISEFHRDIQLSMSSVDLDDSAVHCVNLFIRALNSTIIKMINNKNYRVGATYKL